MILRRFFAYGTLRRGGRAPMAGRLADAARWIGPARASGHLYLIGHYPGLVPDADGGAVVGDLLELYDPARMLPVLDNYEECAIRFPQPHEYRREVIRVRTRSGTVLAWTYVYARPVEDCVPIPGGDFLARRRAPCMRRSLS